MSSRVVLLMHPRMNSTWERWSNATSIPQNLSDVLANFWAHPCMSPRRAAPSLQPSRRFPREGQCPGGMVPWEAVLAGPAGSSQPWHGLAAFWGAASQREASFGRHRPGHECSGCRSPGRHVKGTHVRDSTAGHPRPCLRETRASHSH